MLFNSNSFYLNALKVLSCYLRLPYSQQKRKVIFERPQIKKTNEEPQKNLIIEWDLPKIIVKQTVNWLGVEKQDPEEYRSKYSGSLIKSEDLPNFVKDLDRESGYNKYVNESSNSPEIEGDLEALKYIDLDAEGLSDYKEYLIRKKSTLKYEYSTPF